MTTSTEAGWTPDDDADVVRPDTDRSGGAATPDRPRWPVVLEQRDGPKYKTLPEWVEGHLAPLIRRRLGGQLTWCEKWWAHPEAVSRLNALWDEWEKARVEGTMSSWWIYHCDPHLAVLTSRDNGPFMSCRADEQVTRHTRLDPLPCAPSDPDLWRGAAFSDPDQIQREGHELD